MRLAISGSLQMTFKETSSETSKLNKKHNMGTKIICLEEFVVEVKITKGLYKDAKSIAEMAYSAGPELYDYMYDVNGKNALGFLTYEYTKGTGVTGHKNLTLAVVEDEVIGTGSFYNMAEFVRIGLQTVVNIFRYYGIKSGLQVMSRMKHGPSVMRQPGLKEMYVANLGVREDYRSKGVGTKLIEWQKEIAISKGYKLMSLDVATHNRQAQKLYERLGFQVRVKDKVFSGKYREPISSNEMTMRL